MRRSEMSTEQLAERDRIVNLLSAAGWKASDQQKRFDNGVWTYYEVVMEYRGPMRLRMSYHAAKRTLHLTLEASDGKGVGLRISCPDKLDRLLDTIIGFQDRVSGLNYKDHVRSIVRLCPETYAAVGPEGEDMVRLVDSRSS
jgi:hypothetical protein